MVSVAVGVGRCLGFAGAVGWGEASAAPVWPGWGDRLGLVRPPGTGVWCSAAAASLWLAQPTAPATPSIRPPLAMSITRRDTAGCSGRRWSPVFWVYLHI